MECRPLFYPEACGTDTVTFERHSYTDNSRKEMSCFVRGQSAEAILIHILFVFADRVHHFHNALLMNPASVEKYEKIMRESQFPFNNELMLITKGQRIIVQYEVASQPWQLHYFSGDIGQRYDAVLSLDYYASLWSEYNSLVLGRSFISLRMIAQPFGNDTAADNEDYSGFYKLWCDRNVSLKRCHVLLPSDFVAGAMPVNGQTYNVTGIVIDTRRTDNLLPYDLYVQWRYNNQKNLLIGHNQSTALLQLNHQFEFDVNRESADIVLGLDFLTIFQKAEYNLEAGYYKVWYYDYLYTRHEWHLAHDLIISLFVSTLLTIFFYWVISVNYNVQENVLRGEQRLGFLYSVVLNEVLTYAVGVTLVAMALSFVDGINAATLHFASADHKSRALLFSAILLYHVVLGLYYLGWRNKTLSRHASLYYYRYVWYKTRAKDPRGRTYSLTETPSDDIRLQDVIMRNLTLNNTLAMALLLIFNYMSQDKPFLLGICVVISPVVSYYWLKMLLVAVHAVTRLPYERSFVFLTVISMALFIVYFVLAFPLVFLSFFREFNSMYSDVYLWVFTMNIYCVIVELAVGIVFIITIRQRHDYTYRG
jgi:hypothetical protein